MKAESNVIFLPFWFCYIIQVFTFNCILLQLNNIKKVAIHESMMWSTNAGPNTTGICWMTRLLKCSTFNNPSKIYCSAWQRSMKGQIYNKLIALTSIDSWVMGLSYWHWCQCHTCADAECLGDQLSNLIEDMYVASFRSHFKVF